SSEERRTWSSMFCSARIGLPAATLPTTGIDTALRRFWSSSASWTSWTVRDLLGSRLIRPRRSSWFRWLWTVELELRPTASPISRTLGGRRAVVVAGAVVAISLGLAVAAHGGTAPAYTNVVVQPGDTLWGIASEHYPADDVRARVQDIEQANGLRGPTIEVGQSLHLP